MMDIKKVLLQQFINSLIKKTSGSGTKNENIRPAITRKLHKPIITKFKKRKVESTFKDNTWGADLADMALISKFKQIFIQCK